MLNNFDFSLCQYDVNSTDFYKNIMLEPLYNKQMKDVDHDKFMVYVVACYDKNSPIIKSYPVYWERKLKVGEFCGFPMRGGKFLKHYEEITLEECNVANEIITRYIINNNSPEWIYLNVLWQRQEEQVRGTQEKADRVDEVRKTYEEIKRIEQLMYSATDTTDNLRKKLYSFAGQLMPRPENIAEKLNKNIVPVKDVYYESE